MDDGSSSDAEDNLTEKEFWEELEDIVSTPCRTHERIDDTLRTWISLSTRYRESYLHTPEDLARCSITLHESPLLQRHEEYVRRQLVFALLQEDDPITLHLIAAFLLVDGKKTEKCFELMRVESCFPRLVQLIGEQVDDDMGLHRLLLELLYEMARIQKISWDDLRTVDDAFVLFLFQIIESLANDVNDPYHDPVMHVLLVLNEQYMVSAQEPSKDTAPTQAITNRVVKALCTHGGTYKTFGENIILLLNRESEISLQLLILKILYLLFTTPTAYEYFYTNDLHVLTDILIRNLFDLPADFASLHVANEELSNPQQQLTTSTTSLRHTYLRVLHPLLAHTQLKNPPHYKRDELRRLLFVLADTGHINRHFERPDDTTVRLVRRCLSVPWLYDPDDETLDADAANPSSIDNHGTIVPQPVSVSLSSGEELQPHDDPQALGNDYDNDNEDDADEDGAGQGLKRETSGHVRAGKAIVANRSLGLELPEARESSLSVNEIAAQTEKPGVLAPSRGIAAGSAVRSALGSE